MLSKSCETFSYMLLQICVCKTLYDEVALLLGHSSRVTATEGSDGLSFSSLLINRRLLAAMIISGDSA